jgi:hypothetical protein
MAEVEFVVEPDCVGADIGWESVAFIAIHGPSVSTSAAKLVSTLLIASDCEIVLTELE